jgi:hypothetical protein
MQQDAAVQHYGHSQSKGFSSGRIAGYQLCLLLWSTVGATYWPGLLLEVLYDRGGFAMPGSEQGMYHTRTSAVGVGQHGRVLHQNSRGAPAKISASHQIDWGARLPIFLLNYRTPIHDNMDLTLASLVFGRALRLPCDLFSAAPEKERPAHDHAANLLAQLHDIYNYAHQHLKLNSDWMKTLYDRPVNCTGYHEGDIM